MPDASDGKRLLLAGLLARAFRGQLKATEVVHLAWLLGRITLVLDFDGELHELTLTERQGCELLGWLYPTFRRGSGDDQAAELQELLQWGTDERFSAEVLADLLESLGQDSAVESVKLPEGVARRLR